MIKLNRASNTAVLAIALFISTFSSCGGKKHRRASTPRTPGPTYAGTQRDAKKRLAVSIGYTEEGVASWYGNPYHGRAAADGEIYDMETLVAAHRLMPFNTWLRVTNLSNSKTVDVRIIDRGPFVGGRIIDLSRAAARNIDLLGPGVGRVRLEVIAAPLDVPANDSYAVQVGAFAVQENAEALRRQYAQRFGNAQLALKQGSAPLWRVLVGKEPSVQAAQQLLTVLAAENRSVFVVRLDETVLKGGHDAVVPPAVTPPSATPPAAPDAAANPNVPR